MHASSRHFALRAAAKVTLSASVFGCGGATLSAEDAVPPADAAVARDVEHLESGAVTDAVVDVRVAPETSPAEAGACPSASGDLDAGVPAATFACCTAYLEAEGHSTDGSVAVLDPSRPPVHACCAAVIAYVGTGAAGAWQAAAPLLPACCDGVFAPHGAACTPWGPPVPPAMDSIALLELV